VLSEQEAKSDVKVETVIWCLIGKKAGDNTQVRALAAATASATGFRVEEKSINARPWELLTHLTLGPSLAGINTSDSSPLKAPWPDIVITAGRRNEPVAQWIAGQSGGNSRLVHIGRPWAPLASWDLVVTTAQYFLPQASNIVHNSLPLHVVAPEGLDEAASRLRERLQAMPRPWIALLVGGNSGRFVFTAAKAARLGQLASEVAKRTGGTLVFTDSARTPPEAGDAVAAQLVEPKVCYRWGQNGENPYQGLLGAADAFIVTGESMSMLAEAAGSGQPLFIFDVSDQTQPWWRHAHNFRWAPLSFRLAMRFGPQRMRRDIGKIQSALVEEERALWLNQSTVESVQLESVASTTGRESAALIAQRELALSAEAVRQLLPAG